MLSWPKRGKYFKDYEVWNLTLCTTLLKPIKPHLPKNVNPGRSVSWHHLDCNMHWKVRSNVWKVFFFPLLQDNKSVIWDTLLHVTFLVRSPDSFSICAVSKWVPFSHVKGEYSSTYRNVQVWEISALYCTLYSVNTTTKITASDTTDTKSGSTPAVNERMPCK